MVPRRRTISLLSIGVFIIAGTLFLLERNQFLTLETQPSLLAQIIGSEFGLVKSWQEHGAFDKELSLGEKGRSVRMLQTFLVWNQSYDKEYVTGYFGPYTHAAVKSYQKEYGLPQTGVLDDATRQHINDIFFSELCPDSDDERLRSTIEITQKDPVPGGYIPPNLVQVEGATRTGDIVCLDKIAYEAWQEMRHAASDAGYDFVITSGYRRPEIQQLILEYWLAIEGESAYSEVARPGHSEHQLGTAIDITSAEIRYAPVAKKLSETEGYAWLMEHAGDYGFRLSYPEDSVDETGYKYEPWHWRYVGTSDEALAK